MQEKSKNEAQAVRAAFENSKSSVVDMLVDAVFEVSLAVPEVVKKKFDTLRA